MSDTTRLSRFEAARVIAQRDFRAILFSRAFLFFLLGPLFPIIIGVRNVCCVHWYCGCT